MPSVSSLLPVELIVLAASNPGSSHLVTARREARRAHTIAIAYCAGVFWLAGKLTQVLSLLLR